MQWLDWCPWAICADSMGSKPRLISSPPHFILVGVLAGIVGYVGNQEVLQVLLRSIPRMAYVGTDSWGMCTCDGTLHVRKALGRPVEPLAQGNASLPGRTGMAHTRWATHGEVSETNTHPVMDCRGSIAVVHNGVIQNHEKVRAVLEGKGHKFATSTDTEVIPHLVEEMQRNGSSLAAAVATAYQTLSGSYSFALLSTKESNRIYACRRQHPLYIGTSSTSSLVTSEPACLVGIAHRASSLATGELAVLGPEGIQTLDIASGKERERSWVSVERQHLAERRLGFRHYMEKEINFEPELLLIMGLGDLMGIELIADGVESSDRLYLIGDSISYNSCLVSSYLLDEIAGIRASVFLADEFRRCGERPSRGDLVIGMSSGSAETSFLEALQLAREGQARTALVTADGVPEMGYVDNLVRLATWGPKDLSPMGIFTGQVSVSLVLGHAIKGQIDRARKELSQLGKSLKESIVDIRRKTHVLATQVYLSDSVLLFGRDELYPVALEAAGRLSELAGLRAVGLEKPATAAGQLFQAGSKDTCLFFLRKGDDALARNLKEAREAGVRTIGICEGKASAAGDAISVPESRHMFAVSGMLPAHLLTYESSVLRGRDPDRVALPIS